MAKVGSSISLEDFIKHILLSIIILSGYLEILTLYTLEYRQRQE